MSDRIFFTAIDQNYWFSIATAPILKLKDGLPNFDTSVNAPKAHGVRVFATRSFIVSLGHDAHDGWLQTTLTTRNPSLAREELTDSRVTEALRPGRPAIQGKLHVNKENAEAFLRRRHPPNSVRTEILRKESLAKAKR